jgi:hypothetical protein
MLPRALSVATLALLISALAAVAEPIDPAQAIAQKFSEASEPAANTDRLDHDYELDMLQRAREEEVERRKADAQKTVARAIPPVAAAPVAAPPATPRPEPRPRLADPAPRPAPVAQTVQTAAPPSPQPPPQPAARVTQDAPKGEVRATILLVLERDEDNRTSSIKPDPIVCFDQNCWISNGLEDAARPMPRSEALALTSTGAATADSCSGKSGCVFRNIGLASGAQIQVVQVGESRGIASGSYTVSSDTTCRKEDGDLVCDNPLVTHGFRIWIVPEATARAAGAAGLEDAVAEGLPDDDDAPPSDDK